MLNIDELRVAGIMREMAEADLEKEITPEDIIDGYGYAGVTNDDPEFSTTVLFNLEGGHIINVELDDLPDINDILHENPNLYDDIDNAVRNSFYDLMLEESNDVKNCNVEIDNFEPTGEISFHGSIGQEFYTEFEGSAVASDGLVSIDSDSLDITGVFNEKDIIDTVSNALEQKIIDIDINTNWDLGEPEFDNFEPSENGGRGTMYVDDRSASIDFEFQGNSITNVDRNSASGLALNEDFPIRSLAMSVQDNFKDFYQEQTKNVDITNMYLSSASSVHFEASLGEQLGAKIEGEYDVSDNSLYVYSADGMIPDKEIPNMAIIRDAVIDTLDTELSNVHDYSVNSVQPDINSFDGNLGKDIMKVHFEGSYDRNSDTVSINPIGSFDFSNAEKSLQSVDELKQEPRDRSIKQLHNEQSHNIDKTNTKKENNIDI